MSTDSRQGVSQIATLVAAEASNALPLTSTVVSSAEHLFVLMLTAITGYKGWCRVHRIRLRGGARHQSDPTGRSRYGDITTRAISRCKGVPPRAIQVSAPCGD